MPRQCSCSSHVNFTIKELKSDGLSVALTRPARNIRYIKIVCRLQHDGLEIKITFLGSRVITWRNVKHVTMAV